MRVNFFTVPYVVGLPKVEWSMVVRGVKNVTIFPVALYDKDSSRSQKTDLYLRVILRALVFENSLNLAIFISRLKLPH